MNDEYAEIADLAVDGWWGGSDNRDKIAKHLTMVGEVELAEPAYSFDLLRFWVRKADGAVLYATDSGCSCPSPFEDTKVVDLKETSLANVERVAREESSGSYGRPSVDVVSDVRALIPAMREAGAK